MEYNVKFLKFIFFIVVMQFCRAMEFELKSNQVVFHPAKPIICLFKDSKISVYDLPNMQQKPIKINVFHAIDSCQISSDDFIAAKNMFGSKISIINLNNYKDKRIFVTEEETFFDMLFYGKSSVLFTRSQLKTKNNVHIIRYLNVATGEIINASFFKNSHPIKKWFFLPNGKYIVFKFDTEDIFYPVPSEIVSIFDIDKR